MPRKKTKKSAEKKKKNTKKVKSKSKLKTIKTKPKAKSSKKGKKSMDEPLHDAAIVVVDEDLEVDKEKEIEERRAYLEEARSQEAFD